MGLLSNIADPGATDTLLQAVGHPDANVRAATVTSLGYSAGFGEVPVVAGALADDAPAVRKAARGSLPGLGGKQAADAVAEHAVRDGRRRAQ
jgi:HEAT repeat protein